MRLHDPARPTVPGTTRPCYVNSKGQSLGVIPTMYFEHLAGGTIRVTAMLQNSYNSYGWHHGTMVPEDFPAQMASMAEDLEAWLEKFFGYEAPTMAVSPRPEAAPAKAPSPAKTLDLSDLGL